MNKGTSRIWLGVAIIATLALGFAAVAGAKSKTKTFSSGEIDKVIPDAEDVDVPVTTTQEFKINKKRSKVKDINVGVRITHPFTVDLDLALESPKGTSVGLSSDNPVGSTGTDNDNFGSGSEDCEGALTVFDDEATTPITEPDAGPFAGTFRPEQSLSAFDRSKLKGTWTFSVTDDDSDTSTGVLNCVELEVKYKKKKRRN